MIDLFFQIVFNNVCISLVLAVIAAIVGITLKRPAITHLLWLLVFVKLLTPPFLLISVSQNQWMGETYPLVNFNITEKNDFQLAEDTASGETIDLSHDTGAVKNIQEKHWLIIVWVIGSMVIFIWSTLQVYRFHRLLKKESETGSPEIQSAAEEISACLGLKTVPTIHTTQANISPMVWWIGGKVWVVIPAALINQMNEKQLRWILSHELAHVRRMDYMIRWIEWLVCVCFWWNPVTWWARYNLRANEELCCDALVLSSMKLKPYTYGDSLLKALELLSFPIQQPLAIASGINNGGLLKRRVKMIVSNDLIKSKLPWLQACIILVALIVLPLGFTNAQGSATKEKPPEKTPLEESFPKLNEQESINEDNTRPTQGKDLEGNVAIVPSVISDKSVSKVMSANSEALSAGSPQKDIHGQNVGQSETVRTEKPVASVSSTENIAEKGERLENRDALTPSLSREISDPDDDSYKEVNETKRTVLAEADNQKAMKTLQMKTVTGASIEMASAAIEDGDVMAKKNSSEMLLNSPEISASLPTMDTNNETDGKTFLVSEVDTPPKILRALQPQYPYRAKKNNYTGRITLQFDVSKEGYAVDARVIESEPPDVKELFAEAAFEALEEYRFKPAMKDGKAVDVSGVNLSIVFELTSEKK